MGNGLKRAYSEKFFTIYCYNYLNPLGSYIGRNQDLTNCPKLKLQSKGRPLGDSDDPKATFEPQLLLFMLCLLKDSMLIRMKYSQNHFESTFGSANFKPNKTKLKLVETVKKEPRKSSFPWDHDLIFGKTMKYGLIDGFNIFKT